MSDSPRGGGRRAGRRCPRHQWTRLSRDAVRRAPVAPAAMMLTRRRLIAGSMALAVTPAQARGSYAIAPIAVADGIWMIRPEEHTSELQSLMRISYAVLCL